jgi:hypothetical protein
MPPARTNEDRYICAVGEVSNPFVILAELGMDYTADEVRKSVIPATHPQSQTASPAEKSPESP